jgi:hypothetical protein
MAESEFIEEGVFIQQDNAKPRIGAEDEFWITACQQQNVQLAIDCQPPNSFHLNAVDLGFFRDIQSFQYQKAHFNTTYGIRANPRRVFELISAF